MYHINKWHVSIADSCASDTRPYCIYVTKMPLDVTSDELSAIFSVHVADFLFQPGASNNFSMSEAWIKHLPIVSHFRINQPFRIKQWLHILSINHRKIYFGEKFAIDMIVYFPKSYRIE
jgi:hypothetical protein